MIEFINKNIFGTVVPTLLILCGVYFCFSLKFFYLAHPVKCIKVLLKRNEKDGVSPFRAVTLALAGTLGVGNIVGVASAIALGGFGSIFWMWMSAIAAMIVKYAEIFLAISHRRITKDGKPYGGAMYYIKDTFAMRGRVSVGKWLGLLFAFLCIVNAVTMGSIIQVNSISNAFSGVFGFNKIIIGLILGIVTVFLIRKGTESISKLSEIFIPIMSLGYIIISVWVIIAEWERLPSVVASIFQNAFDFESALGGVVGFFTSQALRFGTMRGILSNEAGCGTAPIAHASANTKSPVEQGVWGIFEVFVDTILLCTMTAIVIILNYDSVAHYSDNSVMMTIKAYSVVLGNFAEYFLTIAILFFGIATVICWSHYGAEALKFITKKKLYIYAYSCIYTVSVALGAVIAPGSVWGIGDFAIGLMTLINILTLFLARREIKRGTLEYFK